MVVALALALVVAAQAAPRDTVVLSGGAVLHGTVLEDDPAGNVVIELESGETWTIPRSTVQRVELAPGPRLPPRPVPPEPPPPLLAAPPPEPTPADPAAAAPPPTDGEDPRLAEVPFFSLGVSTGVAIPLGSLDGVGLGLGSAVTPMWTFSFEAGLRPSAEIELGLLLMIGVGAPRDPLDGYCVAAGSSCTASDAVLGPYARWSLAPRAALNPWVMATFGWEGLRVSNAYDDAFQYDGWQVGAAVGLDLRFVGGGAVSFVAGTRWGEFTGLTVTGYLPAIPFSPAMHGWIDVSVRGSFGLF